MATRTNASTNEKSTSQSRSSSHSFSNLNLNQGNNNLLSPVVSSSKNTVTRSTNVRYNEPTDDNRRQPVQANLGNSSPLSIGFVKFSERDEKHKALSSPSSTSESTLSLRKRLRNAVKSATSPTCAHVFRNPWFNPKPKQAPVNCNRWITLKKNTFKSGVIPHFIRHLLSPMKEATALNVVKDSPASKPKPTKPSQKKQSSNVKSNKCVKHISKPKIHIRSSKKTNICGNGYTETSPAASFIRRKQLWLKMRKLAKSRKPHIKLIQIKNGTPFTFKPIQQKYLRRSMLQSKVKKHGKGKTSPQQNEQIFIKMHDGITLMINFHKETTVMDIKREIETKIIIPITAQKLIFGTKILKNCNTLAFYNIKKDSSIHFKFTLNDGGAGKSTLKDSTNVPTVINQNIIRHINQCSACIEIGCPTADLIMLRMTTPEILQLLSSPISFKISKILTNTFRIRQNIEPITSKANTSTSKSQSLNNDANNNCITTERNAQNLMTQFVNVMEPTPTPLS
jgi:hypothetical protein